MAPITLPGAVAVRLITLAAKLQQAPAEWVPGWLDYAKQVANGDVVASVDTLDNLQWDLEMVSPKGQATLHRMTEEAEAAIARGEVEDSGFDGR